MATRTREDRRLRMLSAVCLGLPEAERILCGAHADFRVHGKIFAYFLRSHGGDGITAACFKGRLGEHVEHVKRAPDRFYLPRFIGRRGWFGFRLDQGDIAWDEVTTLATISYNLAAPRSLRAPVESTANALTSQSLIRGAPAARLDGSHLNVGNLADERQQADSPLRPTAAPGATTISRSGGVRSRR